MKEISKQEKDLLIRNGYIKKYSYESPIYDDNYNYLYTQGKTVYKDLIILNKKKSTKQTYFTTDSFWKILHTF